LLSCLLSDLCDLLCQRSAVWMRIDKRSDSSAQCGDNCTEMSDVIHDTVLC